MTYALDWLGLLIRWLHVVAGIAWIGASFYFVWLDNHLQPISDAAAADPEVAGELWAVHGGGFYRARKYRLAPAQLPPTLHWFYWEAYTTWLSGFALLGLLYFLRAEAYLIDPAVAALSKPAAIGIAMAVLIGGWIVYDALCRSVLARHEGWLAATLCAVCAGEAYGLCHVFSGRGAFLMFGASLGTIMVANVAMVIIPGQRELVRAKQQGREVNPAPGLRAKQRSVHNTYFTLPVLFAMISNHYAMTYAARYNWLVLIVLSAAGACTRAWFVARHRAQHRHGLAAALPAVAGALLLVVIVLLAPAHSSVSPAAMATAAIGSDPPRAAQRARVGLIVAQRCVPCHAVIPTQPGFVAAPKGLVFENPDQLLARVPEVQQQLSLHAMPLGNLTNMTEDERTQVLQWIAQGGR